MSPRLQEKSNQFSLCWYHLNTNNLIFSFFLSLEDDENKDKASDRCIMNCLLTITDIRANLSSLNKSKYEKVCFPSMANSYQLR